MGRLRVRATISDPTTPPLKGRAYVRARLRVMVTLTLQPLAWGGCAGNCGAMVVLLVRLATSTSKT